MNFERDNFYHLYNRSNRGLPVFYNDDSYDYFLKKVNKNWLPYLDIIAYCLMPTQFHFMIKVKEKTEDNKLNNTIGKLLSSYTRALNNQLNLNGSLFQNHTKSKNLFKESRLNDLELISVGYPLACFNYIHQNPIKDNIVTDIIDWQYSSYLEYAGLREATICNLELGEEMFEFKRGNKFIELTKSITKGNFKFE